MDYPSFLDFFINHGFQMVLLLFLLVCSGLISASEVALFSLSPTEVNALKEDENPNGFQVFKLISQPQKLLATILIANNLVNISIVLVFAPLGEVLFEGLHPIVRVILDIGVVTFFILLFGEILPKIYANRNNVSFSLAIARVLQVLNWVLSPVSVPMSGAISLISNKLQKKEASISINEISQAWGLTSEENTTQEEQKIFDGIVSFGNTETREVMRPRLDIIAVNEELTFREVVKHITENGYSRLPVFRENIDNVTGVIYAKDLLPFLNEEEFNWLKIKRKAIFVPENKKLDDLLKEFQQKKTHLAVVVDEYGGTSGIITLEDIIEEIVGEISDEYDVDDSFYSKIDEKTYLFEGKTSLKDFYRILNFDETLLQKFEDAQGDAETIAGFWLEVAGIFPEKGQTISFEGFSFKVESIDKKRIKQLKIVVI